MRYKMIVRASWGNVIASGYVEGREAAEKWANETAEKLHTTGLINIRGATGALHVIPLASVLEIRIEP